MSLHRSSAFSCRNGDFRHAARLIANSQTVSKTMPHFCHLPGVKGLMHKWLGCLMGAAVALAALGGCDDKDNGKKAAKTDRQSATVAAAPQLDPRGLAPQGLGAGWHSTAATRISAWGFVPADDPVGGLRAALNAGMLPPR